MALIFPDNFYWGTAMAAHQVEGANFNNDWWEWEHRENTLCQESSGDACDFLHLYEKDIEMTRNLGFNMFRFSLEWSRIEPSEGEFSKAAINYYRRILQACHKHGMSTNLTFHHFTSPKWLNGTWSDKSTVDKFARFVEYATRALGDEIDFACTINEPNIVAAMGYRFGIFPPGRRSSEDRRLATENFVSAHVKSVEIIKSEFSHIRVGLALSMSDYQPLKGAEARMLKIREIMEDIYLENTKGNDFIGVQNYSRSRVAATGKTDAGPEPGYEVTEM
ncbi:MAG: glycoside hydrolase family 1 protein, partial [Acidimicrobiales bacterium]|nr:glycoside hydrolase family 1 protein [Acidimicrobiales bacterium]